MKSARLDYVERIRGASVYDVARVTPLVHATRLSRRVGCRVLLKREDLQSVFSFKVRGAYNRMSRLSRDELSRGVVTASAGNHAQGVALSAERLGCSATIVMPTATPRIKVDAVAARGARIVLHGSCFDDACVHAHSLERAEGLTFVHPYDDPDVIAGQGTIGLEILDQHPSALRAIFVPVGGGGLIAGIAAVVKVLRPGVRVIGVEPDDADAMARSLAAGRRIRLPRVGLFADGVAVKQVGKEPFRICRELVDEVILVSRAEICAAIRDVFDETRAVLEPAGALSVAGLRAFAEREGVAESDALVAIASGANIDFDRLRGLADEDLEASPRVRRVAAVREVPAAQASGTSFL